jgi:para-aminobenzoate synthetase component 1
MTVLTAVPRARFGLYDAAAVYDHQKEQWYLTAIDWPAPLAMQRPPVAQRLSLLRERLQSASRLALDEPPSPYTTRPVPNMSRKAYVAKLLRAKRYIEAGDVYQVNLTQRFTAQTTATPLELYRRLRTASPSSHAALLMWDDTAIISSSPELFLDLGDGHVVTRPIKGTRPRTGDPRIDAMARRELAVSDKDRAELTMIVDLLRNDLGRVCSFGTVRVTQPGEIEEHPTVFHRVATIEGNLKSGMGWPDLLRAAFPGGSVTGAPKIRAMQIIRELEPTPRGVYCGSIGWIGLDGAMSLNIAIRTIVQRGDRVHLNAGGGIVAESTPDAEYAETLAKLRGMLQALNAEEPWEITRPAREAVPSP